MRSYTSAICSSSHYSELVFSTFSFEEVIDFEIPERKCTAKQPRFKRSVLIPYVFFLGGGWNSLPKSCKFPQILLNCNWREGKGCWFPFQELWISLNAEGSRLSNVKRYLIRIMPSVPFSRKLSPSRFRDPKYLLMPCTLRYIKW